MALRPRYTSSQIKERINVTFRTKSGPIKVYLEFLWEFEISISKRTLWKSLLWVVNNFTLPLVRGSYVIGSCPPSYSVCLHIQLKAALSSVGGVRCSLTAHRCSCISNFDLFLSEEPKIISPFVHWGLYALPNQFDLKYSLELHPKCLR